MDVSRRPTVLPDQERARARELYERAVAADPSDAHAWLSLSYFTDEPRLALEHIQRAVDLLPHDPAVQAGLRYILFERFKDDPFIEFLAETDKNYVVTLRNSRPIVVPKTRNQPEVYPPVKPTPAERAARKLSWLTLGLLSGGVLTLMLTPLVLRDAFGVLGARGVSSREQRSALMTLVLACALALVAFILFVFFVLHWLG